MIVVYTGLPGSGKTARLALMALKRLQYARSVSRNGHVRRVYSNIKFAPHIEERYAQHIHYFDDIYDMPNWKDCDIIIDELAIYFDSREWENLPRSIKRYLRLHRHYGVNIYGAAQDFLTVDNAVRRLCAHLFHLNKKLSSAEPSPYHRNTKFPFCISTSNEVLPSLWGVEKEHYEYTGFPSFYFFTRKHFSVFNTREELPEQPPAPRVKHYVDIIYQGGPRAGQRDQKYI